MSEGQPFKPQAEQTHDDFEVNLLVQSQVKSTKVSQVLKLAENYKYTKFIISESAKPKQTWDMYCMCLVLYVSLVVPYRLGLDIDDTKTVMIIGYVMDLSFLVDLVLNFFTESYDPKTHTLINTHRAIAIQYIKTWFWIDLISIFPFEMVFKMLSTSKRTDELGSFNQSIRIARVTKVYKLVRFFRLAKMARGLKLKNNTAMKNNLKIQNAYTRMGYIIGGLLLLMHLMACIWCSFSQYDASNWMANKVDSLASNNEVILPDEKSKLYILALYYTIQTLTTVGYGDISAANTKERYFQVMVMLIGVVAFSTITGMLTSMISTFDEIRAEKERNSDRLNQLNFQYNFGSKLMI